jgi:hypothetical protein
MEAAQLTDGLERRAAIDGRMNGLGHGIGPERNLALRRRRWYCRGQRESESQSHQTIRSSLRRFEPFLAVAHFCSTL